MTSSGGGGAFSYVDSSGTRYGGSYGLKDGKVVSARGDFKPEHFADNAFHGDNFGPEYLSNFENLIQEVFKTNYENQRLAINAARKAFDLTSNRAPGYYPIPPPIRFPAFNNFPGFGFPGFDYGMPNPIPGFPANAAFASAAAGPGFNHHVASIFPGNPNNPNINKINHYADPATPNRGGFVSVSSNSFASSQNIDGKESTLREAETFVNDNGKITHYKIRN
ncbi:unnamed protein product [Chrysodeixis includens]|uniref:Uncharacterized protein n=1 Tax=Chrysodeixis includens TaxID=689277 RepID=A0A9N8KPF7_CHRIL|nr:unnamed protein product [Chrysodeixis includens]